MFGQLKKTIGRSFLEGRSHIRGRTPSLNRLSNLLTEGDIWTAGRRHREKEKKRKSIKKQREEQMKEQIKLSVNKKAPSLNRLSRARKIEKTSPSTQFSVRAILSRVYVQLDTRPIKKGCREIVYSWKSFEFESAEQYKEKSKTSPSTQFDNSRDS